LVHFLYFFNVVFSGKKGDSTAVVTHYLTHSHNFYVTPALHIHVYGLYCHKDCVN
jgi:hypothetical protein